MIARTILAMEFSSDRRSVALVRDGMILAESIQESGRSTHAISLVADTLSTAGVTPAEVELLALGIGPGSYTGIRLSISVTQGWCLATAGGNPVPIIALNSFEVLAASIMGPAWLASDAQREEWAVARIDGGRVIESARLLSTTELVALAHTGRVIGPEIVQALGVGETDFPKAGRLGQLAQGRTDFVAPESVAPIYLRSAAFVKAPVPRFIPGITDAPII